MLTKCQAVNGTQCGVCNGFCSVTRKEAVLTHMERDKTWKYYSKWKKPAAKQYTVWLHSYAGPKSAYRGRLNWWLPELGSRKRLTVHRYNGGGVLFCFNENDVNYIAVMTIKFHIITKTIKFYTLNEWILWYVNNMAVFFTTKKKNATQWPLPLNRTINWCSNTRTCWNKMTCWHPKHSRVSLHHNQWEAPHSEAFHWTSDGESLLPGGPGCI